LDLRYLTNQRDFKHDTTQAAALQIMRLSGRLPVAFDDMDEIPTEKLK
jgi:hypothetical protein